MRATSVAEVNPIRITLLAALLLPAAWQSPCVAADGVRHDDNFQAGHEAYEASDYAKAARLLQLAVEQHPRDAEIHLLLAKTYYESQRYDAAVASAEKAVALDPQSSLYHEWLGKVYGEKASKEFEKAVELDEKNFSAYQALIEFDCSAPGIAGGGEDKARPEIAKLAALDPAEGHYAQGNCRRQKKDFATAADEFTKALELHPKSVELIYDIGDHAMKHDEPGMLLIVAEQGAQLAPSDPRALFYRAVAFTLIKERPDESERLLREYLQRAPLRSTFPPPWRVHEWLGRLYENQQKTQAATEEFEASLKLEPKSKYAREALKRLKKG